MHTRVVVIKLAVHVPALGVEQIANCIAQRRLAAMADMQRPGRIGRYKFHQNALRVGLVRTKARLTLQNIAHDFLLGAREQAHIDKARPGDVNVLHPLHKSGLR